MGLRDFLRRRQEEKWEKTEAKRQANYDHLMKKADYELASARRQEALALKMAEARRMRVHARELTPTPKQSQPLQQQSQAVPSPKPIQSSGPNIPAILDALNYDPFNPPKKKVKNDEAT